MRYTQLGRTGVQVSSLCFGTMTFGKESDEATSKTVFHRCMDAGINFFDCASVYVQGKSEEILGRLMEGHRQNLVITSKYGSKNFKDANDRSSSRRNLIHTVERSLKALKTDYIDIFYVHRHDWNTDTAEIVRGLDDLVRAGKIVYPAVSNWPVWRIMKAQGIAQLEGRTPIAVLQPVYNLLKRQAEAELLPMAVEEGLGVISYSPIGGGVLSGKYAGGKKPDEGRLLSNASYQERYGSQLVTEAVERYLDFARGQGYHPVSLAVAWAGGHPGVTAPIIGARNIEQLEDSLNSVQIDMTPELWKTLSDLSLPSPMPTDRPDDLWPVWPPSGDES